jgi:hypothetical protein
MPNLQYLRALYLSAEPEQAAMSNIAFRDGTDLELHFKMWF